MERNRTFLIGFILVFVLLLSLFNYLIIDSNSTFNLQRLPLINAVLNGLSFVSLVFALIFIFKKNISMHKKFILSALFFSVLFMISYLFYHFKTSHTIYGGKGAIKTIYYIILVSHIILATLNVPLVLITLIKGIKDNRESHKKFARFAMPVWMYVSITGVIIYIMNIPYY